MESNSLTMDDEETFQTEVPLQNSDRVFNFKYKEQLFAVKKILPGSKGYASQEEWQKLVSLRNTNIVSYHKCILRNSVRYLFMDNCIASLLDVFKGSHAKNSCNLELKDIMWQTARGLEFLHDHNIIHGNLALDQILFWRQRSKSKPLIKITGYFLRSDTRCVRDDLSALGYVYYSVTTNEIAKPNVPVSANQLNLLDKKQQQSASQLINLLINPDDNDLQISIKPFFSHPFFTTQLECARCLLTDERIKNVDILQNWFDSVVNDKFSDSEREDFEDLKFEVSSTESIPSIVATAFTEHSKIFSEFIWYLSTQLSIHIKRQPIFRKDQVIASGGYGIVYSGEWINEHGKKIPAAGKTLRMGTFDDLMKEFDALRQIDHLFVVKCFGLSEVNSEKCLVMELCEGTLKNYILDELQSIPKNSLDYKIILGQVTLGLAYIHNKGMIHKDLKPANILLWKRSAKSELVLAKIADFGFAKQLKPEQEEFSPTMRFGTKNFMAPELLVKMDLRVDKAQATYESDAYSLGIIIGYTVLNGQHPYGDNNICQPILMTSGINPVQLGGLEWDVTHLILQLTKEQPSERPKVSCVIYHPYFVLGNDKSKNHFVQKMDEYFELFKDAKDVYNRSFAKQSIQKWFDLMKCEKEKERNNSVKQAQEKVFEMLVKIDSRLDTHVTNSSEYYSKITTATTSRKNEIYRSVDKWVPRYRIDHIRKRVSMHPEFCVTYLWSLISDKTGHPPFDIPTEGKPPPDRVFDSLEMTECCFGCLYYNKPEEQDELWNLKGYLNNGLSDEKINYLIRKFPRFTTPTAYFQSLYRKLENINHAFETDRGRTILHWALADPWWSDISIVNELLNKNANPNFRDSNGRTSVHYAAMNETDNAPQILKWILEKGGDPNVVDSYQMVTPFHYSASNESNSGIVIIKLLLQYGGKPGDVSKLDGKKTPVHIAVRNKSKLGPTILQLLLDEGASPNDVAVTDEKRTPVHFAAIIEFEAGPENLKLLLDKNGDANALDENDMTPLHLAARNETFGLQYVELLLAKEGNPNLGDKLKRTPVHYAVMNKSEFGLSILKLLLDKGGDPNAVDIENKTPLDLATQNEIFGPRYVELLKEFALRSARILAKEENSNSRT